MVPEATEPVRQVSRLYMKPGSGGKWMLAVIHERFENAQSRLSVGIGKFLSYPVRRTTYGTSYRVGAIGRTPYGYQTLHTLKNVSYTYYYNINNGNNLLLNGYSSI
eukprot:scaffold117873_cov43-Attheya_sp.AAC.1